MNVGRYNSVMSHNLKECFRYRNFKYAERKDDIVEDKIFNMFTGLYRKKLMRKMFIQPKMSWNVTNKFPQITVSSCLECF